jgi:hypothetical protein
MPTITFPLLRGELIKIGAWQSLFAQPGLRVYPFAAGAQVAVDSSNTVVSVAGLGQFVTNDYIMVATQTNYSPGFLYTPQISKITRVSSVGTSTINITPAISVSAGDFLINLGADGAAAPLTAPAYDGSPISLFSTPDGSVLVGDYVVTSALGHFSTWISEGYPVVDLLITTGSGVPFAFIPFFQVGPSVAY